MATILDTSGDALTDEFGRPIIDEMEDPRPASADFAAVLLSLLPPGRVWPKDASSMLSQAMTAIAPTFSRCAARARDVLLENPISGLLFEMLVEWERSLGLPDVCAGPDPTIALRQAHVRARFIYTGGQSVPYFIAYAAALGYTITVTEFAPARYGRPNYGQPRYGKDWAHVWLVHAPAITVTPAQYGAHRSGEPYAAWETASLTCELNRIKPAHTILQFSYA